MIKNRTLRSLFFAAVVGIMLLPSNGAYSATEPFNPGWLEIFREEAISKGVSADTVNRLVPNGLEPLAVVEQQLNAQPEQKKTLAQYLDKRLGTARIEKGRRLMNENMDVLRQIERERGVAPATIMAIWALETNYGGYTGNTKIVPALLTLAQEHSNRDRRIYFRGEAIAALKLIDQGYTEIETKDGSWAGAFGQTQFMPSSFNRFAVDGDGDGRKDIWNNLSDVFASTANYLDLSGWQAGERWGREVQLPKGFDASLLSDRPRDRVDKTAVQWSRLGVRLPGGGALPQDNEIQAMLIAPDGANGRIFMVYPNFRVIMSYNSSYKYALAVSMLAEAIASPQ